MDGEVLQLVIWHHVMTCRVALLTYDGSVKKRFCPCDAAWWLSVEGWPAVMTWWSEELSAVHMSMVWVIFLKLSFVTAVSFNFVCVFVVTWNECTKFILSFIRKWIIHVWYCVWTTVLVFALTQTHLEPILKSCGNDYYCVLSLTCDWKTCLFSLKKRSFCCCCCWGFHVKLKRCHFK